MNNILFINFILQNRKANEDSINRFWKHYQSCLGEFCIETVLSWKQQGKSWHYLVPMTNNEEQMWQYSSWINSVLVSVIKNILLYDALLMAPLTFAPPANWRCLVLQTNIPPLSRYILECRNAKLRYKCLISPSRPCK